MLPSYSIAVLEPSAKLALLTVNGWPLASNAKFAGA